MSEEKRIMDYLGISQIEGNVRGEHLGKLLTFLKMNNGKTWAFITKVTPLIMGGMQKRYIRENFLEGLLELGIIKIYTVGCDYYLEWIGEKALNGVMIPKPEIYIAPEEKKPKEPTHSEMIEKVIKEEKEDKQRKCKNCGKPIPENKAYCNEDCLRKHIDRRNSE